VSSDWYSGSAPAPASAAPGPYSSTGFNSTGGSTATSSITGQSSFPSFAQQQEQPIQVGAGFYQSNSQTQQEQQQPLLSGAMDSSMMMNNASTNIAPGASTSFSMFMPSASSTNQQQSSFQQQDSSMYPPMDEAPLLEELGVNIEHILLKTRAVVLPFSRFGGDQLDPAVICQDADMAGPIALLLLLGGEMLLTGKLQFGYIYGFGLFGCIAMTLVVNLMSPSDAISFWTVTSILGYSLLPVNVLALIKIVVMNLIKLQTLGRLLGLLTVAWSTTASTRLLELGCGMRSQRYLIAYPIALLYSAFVMMTIF
jgi:hypothetical protein